MKIIGHRGARGLAPENTIAALRKGLEHHVDMLEFDLRVTKDNVVILHHDADLKDPSGKRLKINESTYSELTEHKPDLASFAEVLEIIGHPVPLYMEVKQDVPVEPIVKLIKQQLEKDWKSDYFLLGSKNQKTLRALHKALPDIEKIVIEPWSGVRAHRRARQVDAKIISMNQHWLWWGFIIGFKHSDRQLYAYTLNSPKKAVRWASWGLSGVITDYPDRFEK
jgi:glycerophosphoryl diester phosphodiesterase